MGIISIRVNEEEKKLLEQASKLYGSGISSLVKQIVFEKLEDEYDLALAEKSYQEYLKDKKSYSMDEVAEILNIK